MGAIPTPSFLDLGAPACTCATAAEEIKASGLRITGIGGDLSTKAEEVAWLVRMRSRFHQTNQLIADPMEDLSR